MSLQTAVPTETIGVPKIIEGDPHVFRETFNRASFQLSHHLANHPLFELTNLLELAKSMKDDDIYFNAGDVRVHQNWNQTPRTRLTVEQLISRIEHAGAWILIKRAHLDPRYAAVLRQGLAEIEALIGAAFPKRVKKCDAYVFITSPNRVTNYHMDRECNYLLQVRGTKTISLFDRYDREVLPEEEIERFWAQGNSSAVYKEHLQHRAKVFEMTPGTGVHIPVNAPHWVKNDDNISVTLAVTFQFPETALAHVYRWNHFQRKLGLAPTPPGRSRARDALKAWTVAGPWAAREAVKAVVKRVR
jgi:hypothetical protein